MIKLIFFFVLFIFCLGAAGQDSIQQKVAGRKNDITQQDKPYVILISADGFRYDYATKYGAQNLIKLRKAGVKAKSMLSSYPSVTFPNHYTIATGLYPSHHGLVYNQFYDRNKKESYAMNNPKAVGDGSWYGGTPLWVLAEQQGMLSASYYFVGTEAPIKQTHPSYWYKFDDKTDVNYRIDKVVEWLKLPAETRPHFIAFYMSNVDHEGHSYGPESVETAHAVQFVDKAVQSLVDKVSKLNLPVNFVFVSDHGMASVDTVTRINIASMIDTSLFIIGGGGTSLHLYAKDTSSILPTYHLLKSREKDFTVYLRNDIPAKWNYATKDDKYNRIGDLLVVPTFPKVLSSWKGRISPGARGFDPAIKEMHASFYAWGPQIKKGETIPTFENVHIYPFIASLLGLTYTETIDGNPKVLQHVIKK